jgi:hypothetical protein
VACLPNSSLASARNANLLFLPASFDCKRVREMPHQIANSDECYRLVAHFIICPSTHPKRERESNETVASCEDGERATLCEQFRHSIDEIVCIVKCLRIERMSDLFTTRTWPTPASVCLRSCVKHGTKGVVKVMVKVVMMMTMMMMMTTTIVSLAGQVHTNK